MEPGDLRRRCGADGEAFRADERRARIKRSKPYAEFVRQFVTEEPPTDVPYFGSWGQENNEHLFATGLGSSWRDAGARNRLEEIPIIFMPNRHVVKINNLESRIRELEEKYNEVIPHRT